MLKQLVHEDSSVLGEIFQRFRGCAESEKFESFLVFSGGLLAPSFEFFVKTTSASFVFLKSLQTPVPIS